MTSPSSTSYREIPLTQGKVAVVDASDYEWLMQWKWRVKRDDKTGGLYAVRGHNPIVSMHRVILGLNAEDKRVSDHINGDSLNNRRYNLRIATRAQNAYNAKVEKKSLSGTKGVIPRYKNGKRLSTFRAYICHNYQRINIGSFPTLEAAKTARHEAEIRLFGEFSRQR